MSAAKRRHQITWGPAATAVKATRPHTGRQVCGRCLAGDCGMCVRAGCYHPHGTEIRKHGLSVGHVEPPSSGLDGAKLRTEVDR